MYKINSTTEKIHLLKIAAFSLVELQPHIISKYSQDHLQIMINDWLPKYYEDPSNQLTETNKKRTLKKNT